MYAADCIVHNVGEEKSLNHGLEQTVLLPISAAMFLHGLLNPEWGSFRLLVVG